jgi:hypothetical protein
MIDPKEIEKIAKEEVQNVIASLKGGFTDPAQKKALEDIAKDLATLPLLMAKGEDVKLLFDSLKAELALRGSTVALKAQTIVQQAWTNLLVRILTALIAQ